MKFVWINILLLEIVCNAYIDYIYYYTIAFRHWTQKAFVLLQWLTTTGKNILVKYWRIAHKTNSVFFLRLKILSIQICYTWNCSKFFNCYYLLIYVLLSIALNDIYDFFLTANVFYKCLIFNLKPTYYLWWFMGKLLFKYGMKKFFKWYFDLN